MPSDIHFSSGILSTYYFLHSEKISFTLAINTPFINTFRYDDDYDTMHLTGKSSVSPSLKPSHQPKKLYLIFFYRKTTKHEALHLPQKYIYSIILPKQTKPTHLKLALFSCLQQEKQITLQESSRSRPPPSTYL